MPVQVKGLAELNRAMARAPKTLKREYRAGQRRLGEPVRATAESRALAEIGRMPRSPAWGRMRTGLTTRLVYVAPRKRGSKRGPQKRPNLAGLLMDRAMQPALDQHEADIARQFEGFLATMERDWAR